jgi:hypothetical protein
MGHVHVRARNGRDRPSAAAGGTAVVHVQTRVARFQMSTCDAGERRVQTWSSVRMDTVSGAGFDVGRRELRA